MTRMLKSAFASMALAGIIIAPQAFSQSVETTIETQSGEFITVDRSRDRVENGVVRSGRVEAGERGAAREYERNFDQESSTYTTSRSTITNSGATVASGAIVSCDGAGNCARESTYTGPQGQSGSSVSSITRGKDGSIFGSTTTTRPDGAIVQRDRLSSGKVGDRQGELARTGREGTSLRQFERRFEPGAGFQRNSIVTGPEGRNLQTFGEAGCAEGSCSRQIRRIGPEGREKRIESNRSAIAPGEFQRDRIVTDRRGEARSTRRWVRVDRERRPRQ